MKKTFVILMLVLTANTYTFGQTATAQKQGLSKAEQEVRLLEREWLDAYEQYDVEAMNRIVADDFLITHIDSTMQTKPQIVANLKAPRREGQPAMKFFTEDVESRVYNDTVILTGRVVTQYSVGGKTARQQSRYTDTYVKRKGRWQVVASHLTNIAEQKQP